MIEKEQHSIIHDERQCSETPENFPIQQEGSIESKINKSHFKYKIFCNHKYNAENIFHLTASYLGDSIELMPQSVLDSEIDWDKIPYDDWDDAPYSPYTPRKNEKAICFAPSPEKALLAIGKFQENIPKDKGRFYIYTTNKGSIIDLKAPSRWSVRDAVDTGELRTNNPVEVTFVGYIEYEAIKEDRKSS